MHKVVVVEDDQIIRKGICRAIPWADHGFEIVGEAGDGELALSIIEENQPDIVISDIHMPFLNGLDMMSQLKDKTPFTKYIFLTGFEDFTYAQKALQLKAFDYLVKPVDKSILLEKAKQAVEERKSEIVKEQQLTTSFPILQQRFFQCLAKEDTYNLDVEQQLNALQLHLEGSVYSFILLHFKFESEAHTAGLIEQVRYICAPFGEERYHIVSVAENEIGIMLAVDKNEEHKKNFAKFVFQKVSQFTPITMTLGREYSNFFEIAQSYVEARIAMDTRHIIGKWKMYSFDEVLTLSAATTLPIEELEAQLLTEMKQGIPEKVLATLEQLIETVSSQGLSLDDLKVLTLKYTTLLTFEIDKWNKEESLHFNPDTMYKQVMKMETLEEMMQLLRHLVEQWSAVVYKKEENDYKSHVDLAIQYMREHFHDSELTLQKVAKIIHVSAPYLSNLFKLEKGFNFGDFLLELRMHRAMELLRLENIKNYEVSEQVGYSNPQYFSICFKKYTGYSPAEYKKKFK